MAEEAGAAGEIGEDVVQTYLSDNSLSKLTGNIDPTTIERLRTALADAYDAGADFEGLVDAVKETYDGFSTTRAQMIAQTEMNAAYNAGRKQLGIDLGFNQKAWDPDATACEAVCVPNVLDGWIAMDDEFDSGDDAPPSHPNCLVGDTLVLARGISAHTKRAFKGEIIVLRIAGMDDLSVTPNHPILTGRGWIPAKDLNLRDRLVEAVDPSGMLAIIDPDNYQVEARIEQIPSALMMAGEVATCSVPLTAEAFHRDGCVDGEVEIVRPAGALEYNRSLREKNPQLSQNFLFGSSDYRRLALDPDSAAAKILKGAFAATERVMGSGNLGATSALGHSGSTNDAGRSASALFEADPLPCTQDGRPANFNPGGNPEQTLSTHVRFVKLSGIFRRDFDGQVFNLETATGLYCANRIVTHNCDCGLNVRLNPTPSS
jgi:hypothetical protein